MKFKILWPSDRTPVDEYEVPYEELAGIREFTEEEIFVTYADAIQDIVTEFEDNFCTIDQGGDDDWYELDLVDGLKDVDHPNLPQELLEQLENVSKQ